MLGTDSCLIKDAGESCLVLCSGNKRQAMKVEETVPRYRRKSVLTLLSKGDVWDAYLCGQDVAGQPKGAWGKARKEKKLHPWASTESLFLSIPSFEWTLIP